MNVSLDGYVSTPDGDLAWSAPSDELFAFWTDRVASTELALYGRRLWQDMSSHWPSVEDQPDASSAHVTYSRVWKQMPKVIFSSTLSSVDWNARLVASDAVTEIARLKAEDGGDMDIAGATLAHSAMRAGLIDEYVLVTSPVLIGGGKPFFSPLDSWVNLELAETREFPGDVILRRYVTRKG